jgi:hypothetical protein
MPLVNVAGVGAVRIENVTGAMIFEPTEPDELWELHVDVLGAPEGGVMVFECPNSECAVEALMLLIIDSEKNDREAEVPQEA